MSIAIPVLNIEGEKLRMPASAFQLAGFRSWVSSPSFPEGMRASFVRSELFVEMSPESIESHNKVKLEITTAIATLVRDEERGEVFADGVLYTNEQAGVSTEPDLVFASWATLEQGQLRLTPKADREDDYVEIEGSPDLVVEVVSDSSVRKDLTVLREAYFHAGVSEYWIADARHEPLRLTIFERAEDGYRACSPRFGPQRSKVLQRSFVLTRARNRVGRWSYRLQVVEDAV